MRLTAEQLKQHKIAQDPVNRALIEQAMSKGRNVALPAHQTILDHQQQALTANRKLEIRPTSDEEKLNRTEQLYLSWLQNQRNQWIGIQCITLKLGHDCRYTPDFWALDDDGLRAIDTKRSKKDGGHTWEDSLIKIRVAARMYPFIRFLIAEKHGEIFEHKEIKP